MSASAVFLRGVNVNGITVRSADLRACLLEVDGIDAVATVLASGNAVVSTTLDAVSLRQGVERALRQRFAYDAWVVVLGVTDVAAIAQACPYADDDPDVHAYVTLASDPAALDRLEHDAQDVGEVARLSPQALAWQAPKGSSTDTALSKVFARKAFRETTTTRNLRTLAKVVAAADRL